MFWSVDFQVRACLVLGRNDPGCQMAKSDGLGRLPGRQTRHALVTTCYFSFVGDLAKYYY